MKINKLNRLFLLAGLSVCLTNAANAQNNETLLLRSPAVSNNNLAFVYGGDIWISDLNGSNPRRLTINPAVEQSPVFSPNGKFIAFTGNYDGNNDIYVIPIEGGAPKRVTYHPSADLVKGWLSNDELYFT
ncbi:MAG: peptidase S41, partial [Pedobacter sp.]